MGRADGAGAPYLRLRGVRKTYGDVVAVDDVDLDVEAGEFITVLGPSGCGKTTLLRIVAGLERQDGGAIIQADRDISALPPAKRDFGIVFQSYALFPNLTAAQNIAFGLENQGEESGRVRRRVDELLELVGLPDIRDRYPAQLSGGQQQRVALARALALSPGLLLLDEPLSALDASVRAGLRNEIRSIQRHLGVTTLMVTHDQAEALAMADRVVVMDQGRLEQVGSPHDVYFAPATPFVAGFVGQMNWLRGVVADDCSRIVCGDLELAAPKTGEGALPSGSELLVALRPESVRLSVDLDGADVDRLDSEIAGRGGRIGASVRSMEFLGSVYRLALLCDGADGTELVADVSVSDITWADAGVGRRVYVEVPPESMRLYPRATERRAVGGAGAANHDASSVDPPVAGRAGPAGTRPCGPAGVSASVEG